jgi:23S rRNA pseudouridine1911/1915/1917 synthase
MYQPDSIAFPINMTDISSQILYEDNHILILNKKSSQIVHSDKTGDISLEDLVKHYL